jgi:iron complex transport system substrate-binding protein
MAPSLTEVAFALGLGDRVVGVTSYCDHPPEARTRADVGGYLDPNWEAVVGLEPDLVLLIQDHDEAARRLFDLGIPSLQVDQSDVAGILASIRAVAAACGVPDRGDQLAERISARLAAVAAATRGRTPPRVLVVVGRETGTGTVRSVWAAGPDTFYHDVLSLAGGLNACRETSSPYPELSREGLIHLDPDVILDIQPELARQGVDATAALMEWHRLGELRAVREGRVHVLVDPRLEIPGPRVAEAVAVVARTIHPGLEVDPP